MGLPAPGGQRHRTEVQPWRGVRIRRSAGEHRTRLTSAKRRWRRHWPPDARRCFVDRRLRRSPPDRASAASSDGILADRRPPTRRITPSLEKWRRWNTTTIRRLTTSCRHQLLAIALGRSPAWQAALRAKLAAANGEEHDAVESVCAGAGGLPRVRGGPVPPSRSNRAGCSNSFTATARRACRSTRRRRSRPWRRS